MSRQSPSLEEGAVLGNKLDDRSQEVQGLGRKLDSINESLSKKMEHMERNHAVDKGEITGYMRCLREDIVSVRREMLGGHSSLESAMNNKFEALREDMNAIRNLIESLHSKISPHNAAPLTENASVANKRRRTGSMRGNAIVDLRSNVDVDKRMSVANENGESSTHFVPSLRGVEGRSSPDLESVSTRRFLSPESGHLSLVKEADPNVSSAKNPRKRLRDDVPENQSNPEDTNFEEEDEYVPWERNTEFSAAPVQSVEVEMAPSHQNGQIETQEDLGNKLGPRIEEENVDNPSANVEAVNYVAGNSGLAQMEKGETRSNDAENNKPIEGQDENCTSTNQEMSANVLLHAAPASDTDQLVKCVIELMKDFSNPQNPSCPNVVIKMLEKAVEMTNNINALLILAGLHSTGAKTVHSDGHSIEPNKKRAIHYLNHVKEHANFEDVKRRVLILEGDMSRERKLKLKKYKEAHDIKSDAETTHKIGVWYFEVSCNPKRKDRENLLKNAVLWLSKADTVYMCGESAYYLACIYENPKDFEYWTKVLCEFHKRDLSKDERHELCVEFIQKSAERNCASGLGYLGCCYEKGFSKLEKNTTRSLDYQRRAFSEGCVRAAFDYAQLCRRIDDGNDRDAEIYQWYYYGYLMGCPEATYALAKVYSSFGELGQYPDAQKAVRFYHTLIGHDSDKKDVIELKAQAKEDLLAFLVTCDIFGQNVASRKVPKKLRVKTFKDAQRHLELIDDAAKNPEKYSGTQSVSSAFSELEKLLGKENVLLVKEHLNMPVPSPAL